MTSGQAFDCAVVGAGAWGTALADLLARNGHHVKIWAREADVVASIAQSHENQRFLKGVQLAASLESCAQITEAVRSASLVVYAPPSEHFREVVRASAPAVDATATIAVASKGLEPETLKVMTAVASEELRGRSVVALSGPSFAAEVAARQPTAVVAAGPDPDATEFVQLLMSSREFRVYTHDDALGVELGGALKNVMAVATGICEGLGLGYNSRAALITRGLAEMIRLGVALGAQGATFAGLAGMGDLVLTCTGALSRNRALGVAVGQGATLAEAMVGKETVAEGVTTARSALKLAERVGVDMPIVAGVHRILFEGKPARESIAELMERELRAESD
ncbi:MAG TPA: NAD(P)H-dependent glycerol-3-phosphate dehydrogenase [Gemmatimonadaceae bacterium]|nr:NAD(P)H-dependent glycerol-3-phosphate dehydrogenase [Gemmatimonadaceae bacterium]